MGIERTYWVSKKAELDDALSHSSNDSLWIVKQRPWTDHLLEAALNYCLRHQRRGSFGDLLLLEPPRRNAIVPALHALFRRVIGEAFSFKMLPPQQLAEVLSSDRRADLFIGGVVDEGSNTLTLARGDLQLLPVPLSIFTPAGPSIPDFRKFQLDDYGYAVCFGDYEASAHSVLYEVDPDYRRRVHKQRKADEQGFGPSLRRLRLLRRKSRGDIPGISAKTIARIERGETEKPHGETLSKIARVLDVQPEEIASY